tara:strand:+ start:4564 stop:5970 length:1407 start_codon:yes stop_codon:yes gene_type:complete
MSAQLGTYTDWTNNPAQGLAHILKEFYLAPVREQLNQEVMALQLFQKATVDWNGRLAYIPIHIGRNTSVEFLAEGGEFSDADGSVGSQSYEHLVVRAHFLYGHFEITGPAVAAAKSGGKGAFISWMESEMTRLVDDVKNTADQNLISGGSCVGYITSQNAPGAAANWAFDGDYGKLSTAMAAGMTQISMSRMDGPGFQSDGTTSQNPFFLDVVTPGVQINSVNEVAGTINLNTVQNTTSQAAGATPVNPGFGYPVYLTNAGAGNALTASNNQPRGVFANLSERDHFGVDMGGTDAGVAGANGVPVLQPLVLSCNPNNTATTNVRAVLSAERMQQVIDELSVLSGKEPDVILCHPTVRAQYVAVMADAAALVTDTRGKATDGDIGFLNLSYSNIPLKYARHAPRGAMMFLNTKTWKIAELKAGGFADLDGTTILRETRRDRWRGFWCWYYNLVCTQPNANAILCGISIT